MRTNISLEEALEVLLKESTTTEAIDVPILDALGGVLVEDIVSDMNMPPFKKSSFDGYAVRSDDIHNATEDFPVTLKVIDFIPAGHVSSKEIGEGEAIRIMTGAKLPKGADVIIKFEETQFTKETVTIYKGYPSNTNIVRVGEDMEVGNIVLKQGDVIDAQDIGVFATLGKAYAKVFRKPKVAILSTGDELIDIHQPLIEGKIRNSNSYVIAALVKNNGGEPIMLGKCIDDIEIIKEKIQEALAKVDIVITTGGVSVGDCDLVKDAFQEIGADMLFWRVKMPSSKYIVVAKYQKKLLIGLSGKPAAAYAAFEKIVKPVILKMMGRIEQEDTL
ncbi:molybdopterin molybdochelatase [Natronincola peptidivorans]|uniref:Molybdopterin molybdenumtransferase n=1 Tax=Natronincola peptidivorans TaxID=426128 RepID=A0A1I0D7P0_9FIRM|nr:gephyrin-like molybdotransferase Glp [Natronincola peptidivorans]SET28274.1 molybdopterin molybdochelatase [Natronincola peptidivorans]